ncbi:HIT family protein [Methylibium sp.]|uniref:HIT family protein n=1 Tax=Methylibium sp. TaxID=2067992 RepID=UPI003D0B64B9
MNLPRQPGCELCEQPGGVLVHQGPEWRVVRVVDAAFPGFYRVIRQGHVAEFTDLDAAARRQGMEVVAVVEQVLRDLLQATKINLASFGNVVPHLHWHVIARFGWDSHFPQPVWGQALRVVDPPPERRLPVTLEALDARMAKALDAQPAAGD